MLQSLSPHLHSMTGQQIIDQALLTTGTKIADVGGYAVFSQFLDTVHKQYHQEIKQCNENFFYARKYIDLVAYQNQYDFDTQTDIVQSVDKILDVNIKYKLEGYADRSATASYVARDRVTYNGKSYMAKTTVAPNAIFQSASFLLLHEGYAESRETTFYELDTDKRNSGNLENTYAADVTPRPRHIFANNSLYIYPYGDTDIAEGIKLDYLQSPKDVSSASLETDILVPRIYHTNMARTLRQYVYMYQQKEQQAMNAKVDGDMALAACVNDIKMREYGTISQQNADLSHLK